ncbi:Glyoxylase, beta-lactamase superfamily II [Fictibacillus solisalsi]|uniref:Glyoxylase, beta-lactamase superfamily II n=1 Tax=Fictibacillus solisalsi TaxID=459525 RepID=A0A1H0ASH1_9BACL|nr:MBL fold metallo-hydrolase [Fictibacillus solisalsi]SDN36295.1 Glyoxylase, beta-lactamase superfamily II [Fictibacillus solisalsi]
MAIQKLTAAQVASLIIRKSNLFIFDVRNEDAFQNWKIEGEAIHYLNIPYFELLEGVDGILDQLPKDTEILVVCAKEGSSVMVAEMLSEKGLDVFYLEGGMKAWSEYLRPVKIGGLKSGGSIYQFVRIGKGCLSYMIESNGEAMIVDPARMTEPYESFAKEKGITIKYAVDTHLHADHISGGRLLAEKTGSTYYLPPKDADEVTFPYTPLDEGETITVGRTSVSVEPIHSPGHTAGSTTLLIDKTYLLTGDILFVESIGRPDLAGKAEDWVGDLRNTLYHSYRELSDDLTVLPAHYSNISELGNQGEVKAVLGDLFEKNEGLHLDETEFRTAVTENLPPQPNAYQEIRKTNMGKLIPDKETQQEMEIGPNRCAIND